ncbi:MAG: adenosylcobinamide-GDP ribazoletransferase [Dehalococcoidales bacterium]|nr:adenosylcobinamide-GDP ribazoletransferase [Dehalococcoidales bacterium]
MSFLVAVQLLTNIPVPFGREIGPDKLGRATSWFPVVGLILGLVLAGLNWVLAWVLPPVLINAFLLAALVMVTGAMHLDGLADTCDGTAGYKPVEERWRIMHDSRTGAFGVVGIVVVLLVKFAALNSVPAMYINSALILMPVLSRWAMVYTMFAFRYARAEGMGAAYKQATRLPQFIMATIITLAICAALVPALSLVSFVAFAGVWFTVTVLALYLRHKLGGLTGDTYGAVNEVAEAMALVFIVLIF